MAAILVALVWAGYHHRAALLTRFANAVLQPNGWHVETLDDVQLSTSALRSTQLALRHTESNALQTFRDIAVNYTVRGLIAGRIETIVIASAELTLPRASTGSNDNSDPPHAGNRPPAAVSATPQSDILAAIPFDRLRIDHLQIAGDDVVAGPARIQGFTGELRSVQVTCRPERCRATSSLSLALDKLHYADEMRTVELDFATLDAETPVSITLDTTALLLEAQSATLTLPTIRADNTLSGLVTRIHRINMSQTLSPRGFDPADLYVHAEISVGEMNSDLVDVNLESMRLDQHLTWQRDTLHLAGTLLLDGHPLLLNDLHHNQAQDAGQGKFEMPRIDFNDNDRKLSDLWSPLPWPADILAGSASASASVNWQTGDNRVLATGAVRVLMDDLSGYINDIAFLRLTTDFAAELVPEWDLRSTRPASLHLASLDAGIELGNIRSDLRIDSAAGSVGLTGTSFEVFGGTVSSEQVDYQLQNNNSRFTIVIDNIDLNQVLGMSAYQGVSATGLISGQLPVRLHGLNPSIEGGTLTALQPGGTIRYASGRPATGNAASAGNQSLDLVYQALEHYRFSLMETRVDYQESGELDLAIRMEGISPELNGGQRINLNLNINDDIPALLQSLQAARSVTDSIQARLDARQE